ncbi:MAG: cell filamentation protein Fic [Lentisphaeria bacterium]
MFKNHCGASGMNNSELLIYQAADGKIRIDVRLEDETVWLTQDHMARLFGKAKSTINEHIKNIFVEGELVEADVMKKFGISEFQQKGHFWAYPQYFQRRRT